MKHETKRMIGIVPYIFAFWLLDWIAQYYHMIPGNTITRIFTLISAPPALSAGAIFSFAPEDLLFALVGTLCLWAFLKAKSWDKKKFRKGEEYGSARWGTGKDIAPFINPVFSKNVLFTQTERLTIENRAKKPEYARNKNVLVIGGSGSGKTRFHVKPNIMQMYGSYVVTDPKALIS